MPLVDEAGIHGPEKADGNSPGRAEKREAPPTMGHVLDGQTRGAERQLQNGQS